MKRIAAIALSCLAVLAMTSCKSTPDKEIVKGKSLDKMIDSATQTAPQGANLTEKLGAQKTYTKELVDPTGKVKIHVNADVQIPDTQSVTVKRVEPAKFTQDQVNALKAQLVKGDLFSGDDYVPTKGEIQQKIIALQADIAKLGGVPTPGTNGQLTREQQLAQMEQQQVQALQNDLATAPDAHTKTPIDGQMKPFDDGSKGQKVYGLAQTDPWGYESFNVIQWDNGGIVDYTREKNGFSQKMGYFSTKEEISTTESWGGRPYITSADIAKIPDIALTEEQAKQKANTLISALGITDLVCISAEKAYGGSGDMLTGADKFGGNPTYINPRKCVWFLRYGRVVSGVPVTYTAYDCMKVEDDQQSEPWPYEDMTFAIDDSGIVGFNWRSPYQVTDTVTENSNIASFVDSMNVFDTMALVVNAWDGYAEGNSNLKSIDITIDEIRFGLTRITEQNKRNSGLFVPCWDFIGTVHYISQANGQTKTMPDGPVPVLTINAIDGSVINRSLGY